MDSFSSSYMFNNNNNYNNVPINIKNAVIYCRKSSNSNSTEMSISLQKHLCEEFCSINKLQVLKCVNDIVSGRNMNEMTKLQKLINDISSDTLLVVTDVSRFSRNVKQGLEAIDGLKSKQSTVYAVCNHCCYNDSYLQRFQFRLYLSNAELESDQISDRIYRSIDVRRKLGCKIGKSKYGYETYFDKKGMRRERFNRIEQSVINKIKSMLNKKYNITDVIDYLNNNNKLFRDKKWNTQRIKYVLRICNN